MSRYDDTVPELQLSRPNAVWSRKRIDIGWVDLFAGLCGTAFCHDREAQEAAIENAWPSDRGILSCLSVRSGWDLLLESLDLPAGSEVLMSAMTIPDMAAIVRAHQLVPVPLDLDRYRAAPTPETLKQAITPKSKIALIAHLFGNRADLDPMIDIAQDHNMLFVEDCAQAFCGTQFSGNPRADVSMFSFGNIKTQTALGGGVLHLRNLDLRNTMKSRQRDYPLQSRGKYFQRLLKYSGLKLLSTYPVFTAFVGLAGLLGTDINRLLNRSVRGFAATEGLERFRQQPSAPLLGLLAKRLRNDGSRRLLRQKNMGDNLLKRFQDRVECPGTDAAYHHYWVFPVLTDRPQELIQHLHQHGFDATQGESMRTIERPADSPAMEPVVSQDLLDRMVYLPLYPKLTDRAVERMGDVVLTFFENQPHREAVNSRQLEKVEEN